MRGTGHGGPLGEGDHEGSDRRHFDLPAKQIALIKNTLKRNPKTIVISINGSPYGMEAFIDQVPVFVEAWYGGAELGNVVASILFGGVNPSGKIPITFPKRLNDVPAHKNRNTFPGKGQVHYDEGIMSDIVIFDTHGILPRFPFGFGLSYTKFSFQNLSQSTRNNDQLITQ